MCKQPIGSRAVIPWQKFVDHSKKMKVIPKWHEGNAQEEAQGSSKFSHQGGQRVNLLEKLSVTI